MRCTIGTGGFGVCRGTKVGGWIGPHSESWVNGQTARDEQLLSVVRMTMSQTGISDAQVAAATLTFVD